MKLRLLLCAALFAVTSYAVAATPKPFTHASNYMSTRGHQRFVNYKKTGEWTVIKPVVKKAVVAKRVKHHKSLVAKHHRVVKAECVARCHKALQAKKSR
jgi:hypothetical protein